MVESALEQAFELSTSEICMERHKKPFLSEVPVRHGEVGERGKSFGFLDRLLIRFLALHAALCFSLLQWASVGRWLHSMRRKAGADRCRVESSAGPRSLQMIHVVRLVHDPVSKLLQTVGSKKGMKARGCINICHFPLILCQQRAAKKRST